VTEPVLAGPRPVTPTTILARELAEIVDGLGDDVEPGLAERLRHVRDLAGGLDPYLDACTSPESADLAELARRTREAPWASREVVSGSGPLEQEMLSGHVEGRFLAFLVRMLKARRVLEIGMFTGYSALAIAEALPDDGEVVACEVDPYVAGLAREWLDLSAAGSRVSIEVGPALDTVAGLQGAFDLVFIDADKTGYADYYRQVLDSGLLAPGGVIAVDNTLLQGRPWADDPGANGAAVARFNRLVADDPRVEQVLVPLRDGVTLIRRA
jgi:caffeoyl-CoA O-methyltransferase